MGGTAPSTETVLSCLSKTVLVELGRELGVTVPSDATKDTQVATLLSSGALHLPDVLDKLSRDELRAACRAHGLEVTGRSRSDLMARLRDAWKPGATKPPPKSAPGAGRDPWTPLAGDVAQVRHRQYLVEKVVPPPAPGHSTRVALVGLDDDNQGRRLEVLWELELGARVLLPEAHGLGEVRAIDPPRAFGAYLHALKWNAVTATDARLFQSPFRAGIRLMDLQLTPLKKALELPRANLFIADDVGIGKTIEAGLVLQELLLRQRVDYVVIVCPAAICLQWRAEMQKRFGLRFELYNRAFVGSRRQQRGFAVNPWETHNRVIISYQTLRRPEHREPLLNYLGAEGADRKKKSLLILDEAHTVAPASASKYAVDSNVTHVVRHLAERFENRLFLSATPHNGHSNSFSALLEILDPQRFTRGVAISSRRQLEPVMVRRLKSDLREIDAGSYPDRKVIPIQVGTEGDVPEIVLSEMLAEYTRLRKPKKGRGQLVFINLQKRLLSSVEAFSRTLQVHARNLAQPEPVGPDPELDLNDDEYGADDETPADEGAPPTTYPGVDGRARDLLARMRELAAENRAAPDAKVVALLDWIQKNQCPAVSVGGATGRAADRKWSDRRVILFTEYGDTKRYLRQLLRTAIEGTDRDDERILDFHGGMSDDQREEVQLAFNSPPDEHPVRILVATDAAREGVNLQGHCADLFHFDIPWNPARLEQRNGRIDRALQPAPEVHCYYFVYPRRPEDPVLEKLVHKVDTIRRELGSLGAVIADRLSDVLARGIDDRTASDLDAAAELGGRAATAKSELESQRDDLQKLRAEIDEAGRILNASRKVMEFDPALLRDALDVGIEMTGATRIEPVDPAAETFRLPDLPESWQSTLDTLRPARHRDEPPWEWRKRPPLPVVFEPPETMNAAVCHLHLEHPLTKRVLSRFLAQGYSAHDLSRVTILRNRHDSLARVIAFGRLSLFGPGATRLHDELVPIAAQWLESGGGGHLKPFAEEADKKAVSLLEQILVESPTLDRISDKVRERLRTSAPKDFAALWPSLQAEAESRAHDASRKLAARAAAESSALRDILESQRDAIEKSLDAHAQVPFDFTDAEKDQREQFERDKKHMERRLAKIDGEIESEPAQIRDLYQVVLTRIAPVGLVYLWPETRG